MWALLDEADIVVAHNGDNFDIKRMNTFFLKNGMLAPSPFKSIDTLKTSRANFGFISNKLDSLCREIGIGHKLEHAGFKMWQGCMSGEKRAWATLVRYNKKDVELLEQYYTATKAFIKRHPNLALYEENPDNLCVYCTSKRRVKNGKKYTNAGIYQMWLCRACGKYSIDAKNLAKPGVPRPV